MKVVLLEVSAPSINWGMVSGVCVTTLVPGVRQSTWLQLLTFVGDSPVLNSALVPRYFFAVIVTDFVGVTAGTCLSVTATPDATEAELVVSISA